MTKSRRLTRCITCGCTEANACLTMFAGEMQGCSWIVVDHRRGEGLCSVCATIEQYASAMLARAPEHGWGVRELASVIHRSPATLLRALRRLEAKGVAHCNAIGRWERADA